MKNMHKLLLSGIAICAVAATPVLAAGPTVKSAKQQQMMVPSYEVTIKADIERSGADGQKMTQEQRSMYQKAKSKVTTAYNDAREKWNNFFIEDDIKSSITAMQLLHKDVKSENNKEIASVSDVLISRDGNVTLAVSYGGIAGIGDTLYAVPFNEVASIDKDFVTLSMSEKELQLQPQLKSLNTM